MKHMTVGFALLFLAASGGRASPHISEAPELGLEKFSGFFTEVLLPEGGTMSECYEAVFRGGYQSGWWYRRGFGYGVSLGVEAAKGTPIPEDTGWTLSSSEIRLIGGFAGAMLMYCLAGDPCARDFNPFAGLGIQCDAGGERLSAAGFRTDEGIITRFDGYAWSLRASFSVRFLLASSFRFSKRCRALVGVQWTHGGTGIDKSLKYEEDAEDFEATLQDAVRKPDYDFTGFGVIVGIEW